MNLSRQRSCVVFESLKDQWLLQCSFARCFSLSLFAISWGLFSSNDKNLYTFLFTTYRNRSKSTWRAKKQSSVNTGASFFVRSSDVTQQLYSICLNVCQEMTSEDKSKFCSARNLNSYRISSRSKNQIKHSEIEKVARTNNEGDEGEEEERLRAHRIYREWKTRFFMFTW